MRRMEYVGALAVEHPGHMELLPDANSSATARAPSRKFGPSCNQPRDRTAWHSRTYSLSRSMRARCRSRLRVYVPMPKSWSLRASIATRIVTGPLWCCTSVLMPAIILVVSRAAGDCAAQDTCEAAAASPGGASRRRQAGSDGTPLRGARKRSDRSSTKMADLGVRDEEHLAAARANRGAEVDVLRVHEISLVE